MGNVKINLWVAVLLVTLSGGVLTAQEVRVSISSREGYVGVPLDYVISVTGSKKADVPELLGFDGFSVNYAGQNQSSQTSIINGMRSSSVTVQFSWKLTPLREGTLKIPSVAVNVAGEIYNTPAGMVTVTPPRKMDGFKLVLRGEEGKVYRDQVTTVDMDFYVSSEVGNLNFTLPGQNGGSLEGTDFLILDSAPPDQASHDVRQIPIGGRVFYGYVSSRYEGGQQFTVLTIPLNIMPLRAGSLSLEGASVAFSTQSGSFMRPVTESHVIPADSFALEAASLPREIRESPNGILLTRGDLRVTGELSSDRARPGDPLTLTLTLSGLVHPELCEVPPLNSFTSLAEEFSLPAERSTPRSEGHDLKIVQTVRPISVKTRGIPSMDFVYFDLEREEVRRVSTDFIPLAMSSAGDLNWADVENFQSGETKASPLRENDQGIRQNKSSQDVRRGDTRGTTFLASPAYRAGIMAPPALLFLYLSGWGILSLLRKRGERLRGNPRRQLIHSLDRGEDPFATYDRYLRSRLFGGKSFERGELKEKALALDLPVLAELHGRLERERYGGGGIPVKREEMEEVVKRLEVRL